MKALKVVSSLVVALLAVLAAVLWFLARGTQQDIAAYHAAVLKVAQATPSVPPTAAQIGQLPAPVRRFVAFTFPGGVPRLAYVEFEMAGEFRRPKMQNFTATAGKQTIAAGTPSMVFDVTTPILPGIWARAYDAFIDGRMDMRAKVLSAVTVVDEPSSPELDRISLRRWLLESPMYPVALLPGGAVRWEPMDDKHALATVSFRGVTASLVASFGPDGRLLSFDAPQDGDLSTPYHGSGEHAQRTDYQEVQGMMIPMGFSIARAAAGQRYPFWVGRVTQIRFSPA